MSDEVFVAADDGGSPAATPTIPPAMAADVVAAWAELSNVTKTKTVNAGPYKYTYADLGDLLDVARPILAKHSLALLQPLSHQAGPIVTIHTMLIHTSGHVMAWLYDVQMGQTAQQTGSAITYGRRYTSSAALGMAAVGEDDDGQAATAPAVETFDDAAPGPSLIQTKRAVALFDKLGATEPKARRELVSAIVGRNVMWAQLAPDEALVVLEDLAERVEALQAASDAP